MTNKKFELEITDGASDSPSSFKYSPWSSNQKFMKPMLSKVDSIVGNKTTYLYIYDIMNNIEMPILDIIPQSVSESYSSKIVSESGIFGRANPLYFYVGGSGKTLSFSLDLHEDETNKNGSLYTLLDDLKRLSKPFVVKRVNTPRVYLQIGNQFAGKGHLVVDYSFQKPFRNGRYVIAKVNFNFTFEEFAQPSLYLESTATNHVGTPINASIDTLLNMTYYIREYSSLSDMSGASIYDFLGQALDYDYIKTTIFESNKMLGLLDMFSSSFGAMGYQLGQRLNLNISDIVGELLNAGQLFDVDITTATTSPATLGPSRILYGTELSNKIIYIEPEIMGVINLYVEALMLLHPQNRTLNIMGQLRTLQRKVQAEALGTYYQLASTNYSGSTGEKYQALYQAVLSLSRLLSDYSRLFTNLYGAGN